MNRNIKQYLRLSILTTLLLTVTSLAYASDAEVIERGIGLTSVCPFTLSSAGQVITGGFQLALCF